MEWLKGGIFCTSVISSSGRFSYGSLGSFFFKKNSTSFTQKTYLRFCHFFSFSEISAGNSQVFVPVIELGWNEGSQHQFVIPTFRDSPMDFLNVFSVPEGGVNQVISIACHLCFTYGQFFNFIIIISQVVLQIFFNGKNFGCFKAGIVFSCRIQMIPYLSDPFLIFGCL